MLIYQRVYIIIYSGTTYFIGLPSLLIGATWSNWIKYIFMGKKSAQLYHVIALWIFVSYKCPDQNQTRFLPATFTAQVWPITKIHDSVPMCPSWMLQSLVVDCTLLVAGPKIDINRVDVLYEFLWTYRRLGDHVVSRNPTSTEWSRAWCFKVTVSCTASFGDFHREDRPLDFGVLYYRYFPTIYYMYCKTLDGNVKTRFSMV